MAKLSCVHDFPIGCGNNLVSSVADFNHETTLKDSDKSDGLSEVCLMDNKVIDDDEDLLVDAEIAIDDYKPHRKRKKVSVVRDFPDGYGRNLKYEDLIISFGGNKRAIKRRNVFAVKRDFPDGCGTPTSDFGYVQVHIHEQGCVAFLFFYYFIFM